MFMLLYFQGSLLLLKMLSEKHNVSSLKQSLVELFQNMHSDKKSVSRWVNLINKRFLHVTKFLHTGGLICTCSNFHCREQLAKVQDVDSGYQVGGCSCSS